VTAPVGSAAARRVEQSRWVEQLCRQARRMRSIPRLGIACKGDPVQLLEEVCAEALGLFEADGVAVFFDDGAGSMRVHCAAGFADAFLRWAVFATDEMSALAEVDGETSLLEWTQESWTCPDQAVQAGMRCALWAQIRCAGQIGGGLLIGREDGGFAFTDDDRLYAEVLAEYLGARALEMRLQRKIAAMQAEMMQSARQALAGHLASAIAAAMAQPSRAILDCAERAAAAMPPGSALRASQEALRRTAQQLDGLLDPFRGATADGGEERRPTPVGELVMGALRVMEWQLVRDGILVEADWDRELSPLSCRPRELQQVLVSLIGSARGSLNARHPGAHSGKQLRIEARRPARPGANCVEIDVWDAGAGLSAAALARLAEPFASAGGSTGLGAGLALGVCRDIVREHGGSLRLESDEGSYTRVVITLPLEETP
jgi:signal transduction histidine kinase